MTHSSSQIHAEPLNSSSRKARRGQSADTSVPRVRLFLVWGVLVAGAIGLAWRSYQLQILQAAELQEKARQQQVMSLRPYIPRRGIIDREGNVLATDRLVYSLYVHPKIFALPPQEVAAKLAGVLDNWTAAALVEKFQEQETGIRLERALEEDTATKIRRLSLDGVDLDRRYVRFYPQQESVAEVVGYADLDHQGQAGLELTQGKRLERPAAEYLIRRAGNGEIVPAYVPEGMLKLDNQRLQLTLDLRIQQTARQALKAALQQHNAKRGAVIVMDVRDGSLVSLVCEPTFNPNRYWESDVELFKNWTATDLYEPGSTFKPINVAIALDAKAIAPNTVIYDPGRIRIDGWNIFNHDFHARGGNGPMNIAEILQKSSNVGMIQIMQRLDKTQYYKTLRNLGLGEKVGVDLPSDAPSTLKSEEVFTERSIEAATTAFGQGFSLTPLKLVQLHSAIANGGKLVTPHVIAGVVDNDGKFVWQPNYPSKKVFSPENSHIVLEMMESVVEEGSGKTTIIPGYRSAGKTGTAQKARPRGGYIAGAKITSYVAILPVEAPRYTILAVVDEPQGGNTFGSTVAAPIVKSVMEALIAVEGIPPADPAALREAAQRRRNSRNCRQKSELCSNMARDGEEDCDRNQQESNQAYLNTSDFFPSLISNSSQISSES
ncbi:MAG: penicillin-binding protein 2 [Chloroflexaceae bacterium]|nr:penicillin-binding protein 2 [Chloroflexaceae bacterium]